MKYRIISNGNKFRAQGKGWFFFWYDLFCENFSYNIVEFDSFEKAAESVERHTQQHHANLWSVIATTETTSQINPTKYWKASK